MFRKKDTDTDVPGATEGAFRRSVGEGAGKAASQPELPRRKVDLPTGPAGGAPAAPAGEAGLGAATGERPEPDRYGGKRLIVGEGIRLSGEISSCDRLVVEGEVEVTLNDTLALEISSTGRFTGGCEVEEADISGVYEGDLTVRRRLFVRASGRLTGTIRYGELELERGGQIAGNVSVLNSEGGASMGGAPPPIERSRSPLFGGDRGPVEEEADKA
jgi:cytoskeletal protein CcmA (bactofilin family)